MIKIHELLDLILEKLVLLVKRFFFINQDLIKIHHTNVKDYSLKNISVVNYIEIKFKNTFNSIIKKI